ncbi:MAG: hypothetical protein AAF902_26010, partial [Chloroflexota bacterium]
LFEGIQMLRNLLQGKTQSTPSGITNLQFPSGWLAKFHRFGAHTATFLANGFVRVLHALHTVTGGWFPPHFRTPLLVRLLRWGISRYWHGVKDRIKTDANVHFIWSAVNFAFAIIAGFLTDNLLVNGLDSINDQDLREWLKKHAYPDGDIMIDSPLAMGVYYGAFAFEDGDINNPRIEAGTALRITVLSMLTSRGAMFWKFQAGMGDTIFAPFYEVLKKRGVKFEYFHRVHELQPAADGSHIAAIKVGVQATLKQPDNEYQPLVTVNALPCWPSEPLWDQIEQAEELQAKGINLEYYSDPWPDIETKTLEFGKDFDDVILGISLGALPYVAGKLIEQKPAWKTMVNSVKSVRTQAAQLWMIPSAYELGWQHMGRPIVSYNEGALNTWGDMSHLVGRECYLYQANQYPLSVAYFCGPMLETEPLPMTSVGPYLPVDQLPQAEATAQVKKDTLAFLKNKIGLWPNAVEHCSDGCRDFKWDLLFDGRETVARGESRFDSQYWRANLQPSERYVLSVPGSSQHRLPVYNKADYANLYLAGDWVANHLNFGCVEAGVISGLLLSNAMTSYPPKDEIVTLDL